MQTIMYIGGYGREGISRFAVNGGTLYPIDFYPTVNPSYLCFSPDGQHLYAVGETQHYRDHFGGYVQSYDFDADGKLTLTSVQPTGGADPCHLTVVGNLLIVANYTSGSISRFVLEEDGRIGARLPLIEHRGSGPRRDRQSGAHMHQVQRTADGRYLAAVDLGLDAIFFYPVGQLTMDTPTPIRISTPAGFGPRHCVFPEGTDVWYVICELESQILIYRGTPENALLIGRVPVGNGTWENAPAALRLSPDGRLLLATGRGQNVLTLFSILSSGMLARLTEVSSMGDWPRDAQFTPDGRHIVCANERSNTLTVFALTGGHLEYHSTLSLSAPACVLFRQEG